jgi:hypothetical protein
MSSLSSFAIFSSASSRLLESLFTVISWDWTSFCSDDMLRSCVLVHYFVLGLSMMAPIVFLIIDAFSECLFIEGRVRCGGRLVGGGSSCRVMAVCSCRV